VTRRATRIISLVLTAAGIVAAVGGATAARVEAPPVNLTPPALSGAPVVGGTLTGTLGTWQGRGNKYATTWLRCPSTGSCVAVQSGTSLTYSPAAGDAGAAIQLRVTATNRDGSTSAVSSPSGAVQAPAPPPDTTAPSTPTVTASGATTTSVGLSWPASTDNVGVTGYTVTASSGVSAKTAATSYTVTGLTCGTSYTFGVSAYDAAGNTSSRGSATASTAACADTQAPTAPGTPTTTATDSSITLAWAPSSDNVGVTSYGVYSNGSRVASTAATSYQFTNLACATQYQLAVDAVDAAGNTSVKAPATASTSACSTPTDPVGGGRKLVFSDEFDGTTVNTSKWTLYNSAGNGGNGLRRPSAITLDGAGHLVITADMENGTLVSGGMNAKLDLTYGYYEFRVRTEVDPTATTSGVVLMWPTSGNWPTDGETDIYETGSYTNTRSPFYSFVHWGSTNQQTSTVQNADGTQWHTMGLDWTPSALKFYRDGVLVWTVTNSAAIPDVMQHMAIQLDATKTRTLTQPVRMYVDWVRIYH
jgi:chitodextrinase